MFAILSKVTYPLHKLYIARPWQHEKYCYRSFPFDSCCQICMCKRGIQHIMQSWYFCEISYIYLCRCAFITVKMLNLFQQN